MTFYLNGQQITEKLAACHFASANQMCDLAEIQSMWAQCKKSEDARDNYLPAELEIIAA